jgi:hypothetical protein
MVQIKSFFNDHLFILNVLYYMFYNIIHWMYAVFVCIVVLFDNNILHLCILLNIISIDTYSIIHFRKCPLTLLERKHEKKKSHKKILQNIGIDYKCNHEYESSIEHMILIWLLVCLRILVLMISNIKIGVNHI